MAGSVGLALLLVLGASFLSKEPRKGSLIGTSGNNSETSVNLTALIKERIAAQKAEAPSEDWQKEFNSITSKPLNPATDLASSTLTDLLARSLFTQFTAAQNGGGLDAAAQQRVIDETLGKINLRFTIYTEKDIRIGSENTAALRGYGNALGQLIRDNSSTDTNEAVVLSQALAQNNPRGLQGISPIATSYHNLLSAALRLSVPPSAVKAHLSLVNSLSAIGDSVDAMMVAFQDPVRTVLYINKYEENVQALSNSFVQIASLLKSSGVVFSSNESGSIVMSMGSK
ncbi:hypothetical protein K8Q93_00980 [Candidatus Parcubacteria bacterium]|nr:hypothetical protein [Candidatus Parcubacteria bacterium]